MFNTPILFIFFANPDTTMQVFERIRQVKPAKLYVAADAPRIYKRGEVQRYIAARRLVEKVDWDCEVKTLFRDINLGPKVAVSQAITWFFEQEEYGIILEHDCLPDLSFFPFCEEMLVRYKDDERIGHIAGSNFIPEVKNHDYSYDFSCVILHVWGWATWRRVWKNYDVNVPFWEEEKEKRPLMFYNLREKIYFTTFISDTLKSRNGINTWDIQYYCSIRLQNQLAIHPAVNLITNIGLGDPHAVHTAKLGKRKKLSPPISSIEFPLRHPKYVLRNKKSDDIRIRKLFFSWKRLIRYFLKNY